MARRNRENTDVTATTDAGVGAGGAPVVGFGGAVGEPVAEITHLGAAADVVVPDAPAPETRDPAPETRPLHPELAPLIDEQAAVHAAHATVQTLAAQVHAMEAALESLIRDQRAVINRKTQELREAIDARQKLRAISQVEAELAAKRKKLGLA